jgi:hypothetical protein
MLPSETKLSPPVGSFIPLLSKNICASTLVLGCGPRRFGCPEEQGGQRSELVVEKPRIRRGALHHIALPCERDRLLRHKSTRGHGLIPPGLGE